MKTVKLYGRPVLRDPYLVAAWPGMGYVAWGASEYLRKKLGAREFGQIESAGFFHSTGVLIKDSIIEVPRLPESKFYYWKNRGPGHDLIIFIGGAQPASDRESEFAHRILDVAEKFKTKRIYTFAAAPAPIVHTQRPRVLGVATSRELTKILRGNDVVLMGDAHISGMNGLLLGIAKGRQMEGICLLAEVPYYTLQIENPRSSQAVLEVFAKLTGIKVDMTKIELLARHTEKELEKLGEGIKEAMDKFVDYFKLAKQPITEADIERFKKSLDIYMGIPKSAKGKIDRLFDEAKKDPSRAMDLKAELDRWGIFKEYEDRFLDLFKKKDKKGDN